MRSEILDLAFEGSGAFRNSLRWISFALRVGRLTAAVMPQPNRSSMRSSAAATR